MKTVRKKQVRYYVLDKYYALVDWDYKGNVVRAKIPTQPFPTTSPTKTKKTKNPNKVCKIIKNKV